MEIHHYDPSTGNFLSSSDADESPLEPGQVLIPAYATEIPPPAVGEGQRAVFDAGGWRVDEAVQSVDQERQPTLDDLRDGKRIDIDAAYRLAIAPVVAGYTQEERDSWAMQVAEARGRLADPAAPAPLLDAIAEERGMLVGDLAALVASKADQYTVIAGAAFGRRRARLAAVDAALTAEAVSAVVW